MDDDGAGVPISVAVILLAAFGAVMLVTGWMRGNPGTPTPSASLATPAASFPAEASGKPILSVSDALAIQGRDDASEIAVAGWFQQPLALPCPAPRVPPVPIIEGPCTYSGWLMADPESIIRSIANGLATQGPVGPAFQTAFDGPGMDWAIPLPRTGNSMPTPVVLIGHFDDPRAVGCQPENHQECSDRFVVTAVDWANGVQNP